MTYHATVPPRCHDAILVAGDEQPVVIPLDVGAIPRSATVRLEVIEPLEVGGCRKAKHDVADMVGRRRAGQRIPRDNAPVRAVEAMEEPLPVGHGVDSNAGR
jgi:hypothetical protein